MYLKEATLFNSPIFVVCGVKCWTMFGVPSEHFQRIRQETNVFKGYFVPLYRINTTFILLFTGWKVKNETQSSRN